jgi:hypothetical protein
MRRTFIAVLRSRRGVAEDVPAGARADAGDRMAVGKLGTLGKPHDADALPGWLLVGSGAVRGPDIPRSVTNTLMLRQTTAKETDDMRNNAKQHIRTLRITDERAGRTE